MSTTVDPNATTIPLDGFPLAILCVSCVLLALSIVSVALRTYIRLARKTFGLDDTLVVAGTVVYSAVVGLTIYGVLIGLGRLEKDLNLWQWSEAMKIYIIWILMYVIALALIKSSVCITILRIASTKTPLRITVWVLLAVTWASFFITFVGTLTYCRPVNAIWTPSLILSGKGTCAPVDTFVIIGHTATVSTIATDLALVIVPGVLLWNTQMKRQAKLQAFGLLSFASVASIITMVRIPYVNKFEKMTNLQFWVAHTVLCSNIETGIGCIASSIPSLRHYLRRHSGDSSSGPSNGRSNKRIDSEPEQRSRRVREGFRSPTESGFNLSPVHGRPEDKWQRLSDEEVERGIRKDKGFHVDVVVNSAMNTTDSLVGQAR